MLEALFQPKSVAVVGVAREPGKVGRVIFANLIRDFPGKVFAINPKAKTIDSYPAYPSLKAIGEPVDLVVIAVPSRFVLAVLAEAGTVGAKAAIVISAGFKETGVEGAKLERELVKIAQKYQLRVLGPNCLGLMNTKAKLNASFAGSLPKEGKIAFMSQSGALCTALLDWARGEEVGFSKFISLGNKADVDEVDLLAALKDDPQTDVITMYLEGVDKGRELLAKAKEVSLVKPIIAIKSGVTDAGARAVSSHTGTLSGSDKVYQAAFQQTGIIRANNLNEMINFATGFASGRRYSGEPVAIITNAGGPGIMATDALEKTGLRLAQLTPATIDILQSSLPPEANVYNPVDILGDALADRYGQALNVVLADNQVGAVLVILTPQAMTQIKETATAVVQAVSKSKKLVLACFMGKFEVEAGLKILKKANVPSYRSPEEAVATLKAMATYAQSRKYLQEQQKPLKVSVKRERVKELLAQEKNRYLIDIEALAVLAEYGVTVVTARMATNAQEALEAAAEIGYPVVLKAVSPDILHKSDVGALAVNINNDFELRQAYRRVVNNIDKYMPEAEFKGVSVQKMVTNAYEVIIGMNWDPQFGPLIMFGLGGIYVEVLQDVTFRLAPLSLNDVKEMITGINSYPILRGFRGQPKADLKAVEQVLLRISQLAEEWPQITDLDINPLMVLPEGQGAVAVDVRIGVGG